MSARTKYGSKELSLIAETNTMIILNLGKVDTEAIANDFTNNIIKYEQGKINTEFIEEGTYTEIA